MSFSDMWGIIDMFPGVDQWVSMLNRNIAGENMPGFRATRTSFQGSYGSFDAARSGGMRPQASSQASLHGINEIDTSQASIQATGSDTNYAIAGDGYFTLEDNDGNLFYTRDGEFSVGANGRLVTKEGLQVVTKSRLLERGMLNPQPLNATNAARMINQGMGDWQYATTATAANGTLPGASIWYPYFAGTMYDEGGGNHYRDQVIAMKKNFDLGRNPPTSGATLSIESDDWTYLYINGHLLNKSDIVAASSVLGSTNTGDVTSGVWLGQKSVYDVSKYLQQGNNQIVAYSMEGVILEGVRIHANFNDAKGNNVTTNGVDPVTNPWLTKIIGASEVPGGTQTAYASKTDSLVRYPDPHDDRVTRDQSGSIDNVFSPPIGQINSVSYTNPGTGITTYYTQGVDFTVLPSKDGIQWIGATPPAGSLYDIKYDGNITDLLPNPAVNSVSLVRFGATNYIAGTDYNVSVGPNGGITWLPGGARPPAGASYDVTYNYIPIEPGPSGSRFDTLFERDVDDLALARFGDASTLKYSRYGTHILEGTKKAGTPTYEFSVDNDRAKVQRGYLEHANTNSTAETQEMAMAQKMYDALTSLAQLQLKAMDSTLNLIK